MFSCHEVLWRLCCSQPTLISTHMLCYAHVHDYASGWEVLLTSPVIHSHPYHHMFTTRHRRILIIIIKIVIQPIFIWFNTCIQNGG